MIELLIALRKVAPPVVRLSAEKARCEQDTKIEGLSVATMIK